MFLIGFALGLMFGFLLIWLVYVGGPNLKGWRR
jgi:hypothetical protein